MKEIVEELRAENEKLTKERDAAQVAFYSLAQSKIEQSQVEIKRLTKERDEARVAFIEVYDSILFTGSPVTTSRLLYDLRERLRKEASGERQKRPPGSWHTTWGP